MISRHSNNKDGGSPPGQVRVLIVGDSGVGKSSIVHLIIHGRPIRRPMRTVGCSVNVKYFEGLDEDSLSEGREIHGVHSNEEDGNVKNRPFFVELWDIAGHSSYQSSRSLFYNKINGVIFVYDVSKGEQSKSLKKWLTELVKCGSFSAPSSGTDHTYLPVPILVIANKADVRERDPLVIGRMRLWQVANRSRAFESAFAFVKKHKLLSFSSLPDLLPLHVRQSSPPGIVACAREGKLDMDAVNSFFIQLIKRRYFSEEVLDHPHPSPSILNFNFPPSQSNPSMASDTVLTWSSVENSKAKSNENSNISLNTLI